MENKLKVLDLFSGIGGFSLGLERTDGFETVAFCESDIHCHKVLSKHWPEVPIFHDIKKLKAKHLPETIDVICGGFPCQDISVAGQKKGIKDGARSSLWKEFKRIIKEVKPRYALVENVANLRNLGLNQVIKDLWSIGYGCEWHIISARAVGACHLRERVWIIAYPHSGSGAGTKLEKPSNEKRSSSENGGESLRPKDGETCSANIKPSFELTDPVGIGTQVSTQGEFPAEQVSGGDGQKRRTQLSDPNMPRLWKPFASEEEKSEWWAKATAGFRDWWKIESDICRIHDGLPRGLDKVRKERIKQLGNSVVPQIPELIGRAILETIDG